MQFGKLKALKFLEKKLILNQTDFRLVQSLDTFLRHSIGTKESRLSD